jgi:hypothetical protein
MNRAAGAAVDHGRRGPTDHPFFIVMMAKKVKKSLVPVQKWGKGKEEWTPG